MRARSFDWSLAEISLRIRKSVTYRQGSQPRRCSWMTVCDVDVDRSFRTRVSVRDSLSDTGGVCAPIHHVLPNGERAQAVWNTCIAALPSAGSDLRRQMAVGREASTAWLIYNLVAAPQDLPQPAPSAFAFGASLGFSSSAFSPLSLSFSSIRYRPSHAP
jgi:hypothetical protein